MADSTTYLFRYFTSLLFVLSFIFSAQADTDELTLLRQQIKNLQQSNDQYQKQNQNLQNQLEETKAENQRLKSFASEGETLPPKPKKIWKADISLGAVYTSGNTDSTSVAFGAKGIRETADDKLTLELNAHYGETEGTKDKENIKGEVQYNRNITDRFYWLIYSSLERDALADLEYRFTLNPGLGYYIIKNDTMTLSIEGGPAYVAEKLTDLKLESSVRGRVAEMFEYKINDYVTFFQSAEFLENFQETEDFIFTLEGGIQTKLSKSWALRLSAKNRYDNLPAPGTKENDFQATTSVVYSFE